jgi:type I restriction enzyme S subunit
MIPRFLGYASDASQSVHQKACMGHGVTIMHIYIDELKHLRLAVPPLPEQAAIAKYLDYMDRRIRRYISAKQRLIKLLEEQKQAVIYGPVTRGLDPNVRLKASGVPWLGDVPEHWGVVRLGALLRERGEKNDDLKVTEVLSVLRARGVIPYAEKGHIGNKKSDDIARYKIVRPNDIVVNCMNVIIGSVGLSQYEGCLSPVYYVLTRRCECDDPRYLNAYFQTKPFQRSLVRIGNGILAHRMRIPMELLKCEPFPRPPASEHLEIVRYIARATANLTVAIEHAQREVLLLSEYQARLIADVVTGRLDVREAAAGLSNETSQEEMVHDDAEPFFEDDLEDSDSDLETALEEVEV